MQTMTFTLSLVRVPHRSNREEGDGANEPKIEHKSVMVKEVVEALSPLKGEIIIDATYGQGGHTAALKKSGAKVISIDADPSAEADVTGNFGDLEKILKKNLPIGRRVDKIVFDLGWNRGQLASGRGFSFIRDEPLLMSYGKKPRSGFFAKDVLNLWSERAIADALYGYGEERYARIIAKVVIARRDRKPFLTTLELVEVIRDAVPPRYRHQKLHFATKTFQALRIAVNDELKVLEQGLRVAWKLLACGGRIATITFHSVEDRVVKNLFREFKPSGRLIYKKPLAPSAREIKENPSARSAKLRSIEKTCKH